MIYKFLLTKSNGQVTAFDHARYVETRKNLPDGEYEILIKPKSRWDTERMRKYFHGPVLELIEKEERRQGRATSQEQLRSEIKLLYGPWEDVEKGIGGKPLRQLKSMRYYDQNDYKKLLSDVKAFIREHYHCEMPTDEQVS